MTSKKYATPKASVILHLIGDDQFEMRVTTKQGDFYSVYFSQAIPIAAQVKIDICYEEYYSDQKEYHSNPHEFPPEIAKEIDFKSAALKPCQFFHDLIADFYSTMNKE